MIVVRDVFRLKFGKARDMKALMEESKKLMTAEQLKNSRVLFDLVGQVIDPFTSGRVILGFLYRI